MRLFPLLLLLAACATVRPQTPVAASFFIDPVGKEYLLLNDGALVTANPLGQNEFVFFDSSLGAPDAVDVTNPFAVLLFYADYGTVVLLDRTLSEIRRLDLFRIEDMQQPTLLARATDNGIWLFDSWDYRLKQLDQRGRVTITSNDLRLAARLTSEPEALYVYQNLVLLHFPSEQRLGVFTNYGRFERWINLPAGDGFGWLDGRLTGRGAERRWMFDLRTNAPTYRPLESPAAQWLPTGTGYLRLDPSTNRTELIENK